MRNPIRTYVGTCVVAMMLAITIISLSPFSAELSSPTARHSGKSTPDQATRLPWLAQQEANH